MNPTVIVFVATVATLFSVNSQAFSDDKSDLFREEYPKAFVALREVAMNQSIMLELYKVNEDEESLFKWIEYKANGDNRLVTFRFATERSTKVFVYGPTKTFRLRVREDGGFDAMQAGLRGKDDEAVTSIAEYVYCTFAPFGSASLLELEELGDIVIKSFTHENSLVSVDYTLNYEGKALRKCKTTLDPARGWIVYLVEKRPMAGSRYDQVGMGCLGQKKTLVAAKPILQAYATFMATGRST